MIVLIIVLYIVFKIGLAKVFQKAGKNGFGPSSQLQICGCGLNFPIVVGQ